MSERQEPNWAALVGQRVLVRKPPPWNDEPIREVVVVEVTPAGYVRIEFVMNGQPPAEPYWYAPMEWVLLEVLR